MSHFTVMVYGDVDYQLAPFHEFESTGREDEFVVEEDRLQELIDAYESKKQMTVMLDGKWTDMYDDRLYRDPTPEELEKIGSPLGSGHTDGITYTSKDWGDGRGYKCKVHDTSGYEKKNIPYTSLMTLPEFIEYWEGTEAVPYGEEPDLEGVHKYNYYTVNEEGEVLRVVTRTNPNSEWDWYVVGGRWENMILLKDGTYTNQALKKDIDIDKMRSDIEEKAQELYLDYTSRFPGEKIPEFKSLSDLVTLYGDNKEGRHKAQEEYYEQEAVKVLNSIDTEFNVKVEDFIDGEYWFIENRKDTALSTYAFVKDREWHGRGRMGWWGVSIDETSEEKWIIERLEAWESAAPDELITIVDCHV